MFGIGATELFLFVGAILVLTLIWQSWRGGWVPVSAEWRPGLPAEEVEGVLRDSFALVRGAKWRAHGDGWSVCTVRRIPFWAVVFGVFTLPFGLVLLFFARETADLHVLVVDGSDGCRVRAVGRTPQRTLEALDSWLTRMAKHEQV